MKTHSLVGAILVCGVCLFQSLSAFAAETNANAVPTTVFVPVVPPEVSNDLTELRQKMGALERSSKEVSEKWDAVVQQNSSLSNVLTGLQQTLVTQREKEIEMSKQSHSFTLKVIAGAAMAVFLVFLLSYWFQLRALNRVMEISNSLPMPRNPALLEAGGSQASSLLSAIKVLENRINHLEIPGRPQNGNGNGDDMGGPHMTTGSGNMLSLGVFETSTSSPSSLSLLLAKGQTLLDMDRLQDALGCFQEALLLDHNNAEAYLKKGIALERLNRLEPALEAYDEALRLNPKRAITHASKARVLAALHRYDEAISVYDSALGKNGPKSSTPIFVS
jgi:tetratricopeptide (TPR) repeat protein